MQFGFVMHSRHSPGLVVLELVVGVEPEVGLKPEVSGGVVDWVGLVTSGLGLQRIQVCIKLKVSVLRQGLGTRLPPVSEIGTFKCQLHMHSQTQTQTGYSYIHRHAVGQRYANLRCACKAWCGYTFLVCSNTASNIFTKPSDHVQAHNK